MTPARLTIPVAPRTKKNHGRRVYSFRLKRTFNVPSEAFEAFERAALPHLRQQWAGRAPIGEPVNVRAVVYREAARGDLVGYMQAIADVLEAAGVVANDKWIEGWDGTRLAKDKARPRVEIEIGELLPDPVF